MITTEYKDISIGFSEDTERWYLREEYVGLPKDERYDSLKSLKNKIDKVLKKKYIEVSVWCENYRGGMKTIKQITATRPHTRGFRDSVEFWTKSEGDRQTMSGEGLFLDTNKNKQRFSIITQKELEYDNLGKEIATLRSQLETLKEMKQVD